MIPTTSPDNGRTDDPMREGSFHYHVRCLRQIAKQAALDAGLDDIDLDSLVIGRTWVVLQQLAADQAAQSDQDGELIST